MPDPRPPLRRVTLAGLIAVTYFMVSGGPYGLEDLVAKAGYPRSILILLLTPLLWSLPTALMVGELSSALPEEGGFYIWVKRALGPFWGFQEVWLSLASSIFDMAIYPTLFVSYLGRLVPSFATGRNALLIGVALITASVLWNLLGASAVGSGSVWLGAALLAPFALLILVALRHPPSAPHPPFHPTTDLLGGLLIAMWNFMGWDNASTVAGEVEDPQRTYPRAMLLTNLVVALSYILPIAAVWYAGTSLAQWSTGSWADIAGTLSGPLLALAIVFAGMIGSAGAFNALALSYSRLPLVLAQDEAGYLPAFFARLNRDAVPWVALLVLALCWALCLNLGFEHLILLDITLYGASLLLEFLALIALRIREPALPRPFRIPGGVPACILLALGPLFLLLLSVLRSDAERIAGINALLFAVLLAALGVLLYRFASHPAPTRNSGQN